MTTKEKAKELVEKFMQPDCPKSDIDSMLQHSKDCACVCCDEIIQVVFEKNFETDYYWHKVDYWEAVKKEIEKL